MPSSRNRCSAGDGVVLVGHFRCSPRRGQPGNVKCDSPVGRRGEGGERRLRLSGLASPADCKPSPPATERLSTPHRQAYRGDGLERSHSPNRHVCRRTALAHPCDEYGRQVAGQDVAPLRRHEGERRRARSSYARSPTTKRPTTFFRKICGAVHGVTPPVYDARAGVC